MAPDGFILYMYALSLNNWHFEIFVATKGLKIRVYAHSVALSGDQSCSAKTES
jgi:hypothetical protein